MGTVIIGAKCYCGSLGQALHSRFGVSMTHSSGIASSSTHSTKLADNQAIHTEHSLQGVTNGSIALRAR